jgi:hypothetical protein
MLALALAAALTACPQSPPANPAPQIVNASIVHLVGSSIPIAGNSSSGIEFEFNTPFAASLAGRSREVRRMHNGETWVTSFGVVVEAPLGAFLGTDPTLEFYVEKVADPQPYLQYPGDGGRPLVGNMYRIGVTEGDAIALENGAVPMKIWLPVPAGETIGGLFIQRLISTLYVLDFYGADYSWEAGGPDTVFDAANQRIGVKESFFSSEGGPYALFRKGQNLNLISETPNVTPRSTSNFTAYCGKATDVSTSGDFAPPNCNTAMQQKFENLSQGYYDFLVQNMQLTSTELPKISGKILLFQSGVGDTRCTNTNYAAFYVLSQIGNGNIEYCLTTNTDPTGTFPGTTRTEAAKHEIFHAVQHKFIDNLPKKDARGTIYTKFRFIWDWILEGTARASEQSGTTMVIASTRPQRKLIDYFVNPYTPGAPNPNNYGTQDFWVYSGQKAGLGLTYLKEVFKQININLQDAVANKNIDLLNPAKGIEKAYQLEQKFSQYGGFTGMYWRWAKNQGYEKSVKIRTDLVPNPGYPTGYKPWSEFCTPEVFIDSSMNLTNFTFLPKTLVARSPIDPDYNDPAIFIYNDVNNKDVGIPIATDQTFKQSVQIQPLQTRVIRIRFAGLPRDLTVKKMFKISVKPDSSETKLKYKIYSNTISPVSNSSCLTPEPNVTIPDPKPSPSPEDGDQIVSNISALSEVLVFVANVDLDSANSTTPAAKGVTVSVEPVTPQIQVTPQTVGMTGVVSPGLSSYPSSATATIQISNVGNLNSTLEVMAYRVSATVVTPPTSNPPLFPSEPPLLGTFAQPSITLRKNLVSDQANPTPTMNVFVQFKCTSEGNFSGNISIAYKTASTRSDGSAIVNVLNVPVSVICKKPPTSEVFMDLPCWGGKSNITNYSNSFNLRMMQNSLTGLTFSSGFTVTAHRGKITSGPVDDSGGLTVVYTAPAKPYPTLPEGELDWEFLTFNRNGFSNVLQLRLIPSDDPTPVGRVECTFGI